MASLKDVAQRANVSLMTVSRAINAPEKLTQETYRRVKAAIDELNYVPDLSAKKIRGARSASQSIGVLALDTATTPFSVEMLFAIEQTARAHGWTSFVVNLFEQDDVADTVDLLLSHRPTGVIYTTMGLRCVKVPDKLRSRPLVLANCMTQQAGIASYIPDDEEGQYLAMKHLLKQGYRRPLCIHLPFETQASASRRRGLERAWEEAGLALDSLWQHHLPFGDEHYLDAVGIIERYCSPQGAKFDALVCGNDRVAFLAYQTLLAKGIRIPQQVAVVGYDNMVGIGELFLPPLTTVQLPHQEIGRLAALHIINENPSGECVKVASPLLERAST